MSCLKSSMNNCMCDFVYPSYFQFSATIFAFLFIDLQGKMFVKFEMSMPTLSRIGHECGAMYTKLLTVIDVKGRQHRVTVCYCSCETEPCTLVRHKLWPASPKNPIVAFQFGLLDLQHTLFLEAQVSVYAFCATLEHLHSTKRSTNNVSICIDRKSNNFFENEPNKCTLVVFFLTVQVF